MTQKEAMDFMVQAGRNAAATLRQAAIASGAENEEEIVELTRCSPVYMNGIQMPGTGTPSNPVVARRLRERKIR